MVFKNIKPKDLACFVVTTVVLFVCFTLISVFSGFLHEPQRYKTMMVTIVMVFFCQYLIYEPIRFLVMAIDYATWPDEDQPYKAEKGIPKPNHIAYLKVRLRSLRSELLITERHQNEQLNRRYKHIAGDLLLYGSYFIALMVVVVMQEDQCLYYNTNNMQRLFMDNTSYTFGLSQVYFIYQIHFYLRITMVEAFFTPNLYGYEGWWAMEQWQKIGVIRLRQVRPVNPRNGLGVPEWDTTTYSPEWRLPYQRLHYTEKFWRIYDPFRPAEFEVTFLNGLLLNFHHWGYLLRYPELAGYIVLLMSTKVNCLKQIEYLKAYSWLNKNTSALFIDFTMYNADMNAFTVITLRVENSQFGTQLPRAHVDTVRMLGSVETRSAFELFVLFVYAILVIQFGRGVFSKIWHDRAAIREAWTMVDLVIIILNIFLLGLTIMRDIETDDLSELIETNTRGQYLDFQRPLVLHQVLGIVKGFLVAVTTMRLWKVLQFAAVFQHFTHTLFSAWRAVASLAVIILVLLMGIGIALAVPNGNNAEVFHHIIQAVITCLWYSVGFSGGIQPADFFHGGRILGIILYLVLVFLLAILLMNVFASVIYDYFNKTGRDLKEQTGRKQITFWEFLRIEYVDVCARWFRCVRKKYHPRGRTVAQNVERKLQEQEEENKNKLSRPRISDEERHADYLRRGERMFKLMAILNVQVEMLERLVLGDKDGNLPSPPASDSDPEDMPELYRKRSTYSLGQK
ncbi:polycystin-2 [Drosophila biarmipes]|uniref:polycystin-2 n=1 Tax=Drosophila biarmipes TaxID=125945 RepID=UPI0007E79B72|nr:polycystin-2 [Drosophila biarmipes]